MRFKGDYDIPTVSNTSRETRENLVEAVNDFFLSWPARAPEAQPMYACVENESYTRMSSCKK